MKAALKSEAMSYLTYYGLNHNPFPVAPDEVNFYFSEHIEQIVAELTHGILARKGFMVLTGDIGLGKTTIGRRIISTLEQQDIATALVFHTSYEDVELLREINRDFGLEPENLSFSEQMWRLNTFLLDQNRTGRNCAIVIDDAQNLSVQSLELIRMISNLEAYHEKLVQILLIGQPELIEKLQTPELRQLKSRIIISKEAQPLSFEELNNYIQFKLNTAGDRGLLTIEQGAVKLIHQLTHGNFRKTNTLMDRCLYAAFVHNTKVVAKNLVKEAAADLGQEFAPDKPRFLYRVVSVGVPVLIITLGLYAGWPINFTQRSAAPPQSQTDAPLVQPQNTSEATLPPQIYHGKLQEVPASKTDGIAVAAINDAIPTPVTEFLEGYQLSAFKSPFFEALEAGRLEDITARIYGQTGYRLIQLETVPADVREQYGVLAYPHPLTQEDRFLLFWKPALRITKFYYHYMGQDIYDLQEVLASKGFYQDTLDGIVGKNLMKAIIRFQETMGLQITGYPDEQTIFLIFNHKEQS